MIKKIIFFPFKAFKIFLLPSKLLKVLKKRIKPEYAKQEEIRKLERKQKEFVKELRKNPKFRKYKELYTKLVLPKVEHNGVLRKEDLEEINSLIEPAVIELTTKKDHVKQLEEKTVVLGSIVDRLQERVNSIERNLLNGMAKLETTNTNNYEKILRFMNDALANSQNPKRR